MSKYSAIAAVGIIVGFTLAFFSVFQLAKGALLLGSIAMSGGGAIVILSIALLVMTTEFHGGYT